MKVCLTPPHLFEQIVDHCANGEWSRSARKVNRVHPMLEVRDLGENGNKTSRIQLAFNEDPWKADQTVSMNGKFTLHHCVVRAVADTGQVDDQFAGSVRSGERPCLSGPLVTVGDAVMTGQIAETLRRAMSGKIIRGGADNESVTPQLSRSQA